MNIINKLHILKDAAVIAREKFNPIFCKKFNQNFWGNIFQALQGIGRRGKVKFSLQFFGQALA